MALHRANEDPDIAMHSQTLSRERMQRNRQKVLSIDEAMFIFHAKIREGPDCVCAVCHRMMYRSGVVVYNRSNYLKGDVAMLELVYSTEYVCPDGK